MSADADCEGSANGTGTQKNEPPRRKSSSLLPTRRSRSRQMSVNVANMKHGHSLQVHGRHNHHTHQIPKITSRHNCEIKCCTNPEKCTEGDSVHESGHCHWTLGWCNAIRRFSYRWTGISCGPCRLWMSYTLPPWLDSIAIWMLAFIAILGFLMLFGYSFCRFFCAAIRRPNTVQVVATSLHAVYRQGIDFINRITQ